MVPPEIIIIRAISAGGNRCSGHRIIGVDYLTTLTNGINIR
jgi:hypothetical protein